MKIKSIALLGSTGSIGQTTVDIIKKTKQFKVLVLVANSNYSKIINQIKTLNPKVVVINDLDTFCKIKKNYNFKKTIILNNIKNIDKFITKVDILTLFL